MKKDFLGIGCYKIALIVSVCMIVTGSPVSAQSQVQATDKESTSQSADTTPSGAQEAISPEQEAAPSDYALTASPGTSGGVSQNVTLDFKDADILLVLRLLSLKSGVNIVAGPDVTGTVSIRLNDVPWEKALNVVLRTYGYVYERDGNIIRVTTRENLAAEELVTETFVLNYSTAAETEEAIKEILSDRGRIKAVARTNTVIVTDVATNIYKISEIIKRLDKRTPQVYIDSKVIRTSEANINNLGVDWTTQVAAAGAKRGMTFPFQTRGEDESFLGRFFPTDSNPANVGTTATTTGISTGTLDFSGLTATLNLLRSYSTTKIISNPRIVTLSNQKAKVQVGQEIGIPNFERNESTGSFEISGYEMKEVGVVLNVTPHVNDASEILVELEPEVSSFDGYNEVSTGLSAPEFTVTQAKTQVIIKDRETIAIGGLMKDQASNSRSRVPVLGSIPVIGRIFRSSSDDEENTSQAETLFFVTVTIVDTQGQSEAEAHANANANNASTRL